jgi:outer membrane scaffolding protein for murein synthesis (MipA/OmpV family)
MKRSFTLGLRSMTLTASAVAALIVSAGLARADEARRGPPDLLLGLGAVAAPVYEGSDDTEASVLPLVVLNDYYGFNFRPVQLSYNLIDTGAADRSWSMRAGPLVAPALGRDQDDDGDLRGLGDVDTGVMAGGFVDARLGPVTLSLDGAQDVADGHGGALLGIGLGTRLSLSRKLVLTPKISGTWASDDYMQSFFGVTAAQAVTSNYTAFDAEAGFKDVGVAADLRYALSNTWSMTWNVSYTRLVGDAADSPIVTGPGGTRDQIVGRIGVARGFTF